MPKPQDGIVDEDIYMNIFKSALYISMLSLLLGFGCGSDRERATGPDITAPAAVADLVVTALTASSATLGWAAPGDDGESGTARTYDIRYSIGSITSDNWTAASPVTSPPPPGAAGTEQSVTVTGLASATPYYFALKTVDDNDNWSEISNVASGATWADPQLTVSADTLDFGTELNELRIRLTNDGTGTLSWSAAADQSWITLNEGSGATTTEIDTLVVTVDRTGVDAGDYFGTVTITPSGETPVEVTILMNVAGLPDDPVLTFTPDELDFGDETISLTFAITNTGSGTLSWAVTDDQSWLSADPASGTTTTESDIVTVTVDRTTLTPGDYTGSVTITPDGDSAQSVAIQMSVPQPPEYPILSVSTAELDFGDDLTARTFMITNTGTGTLTWTAAGNQSWLAVGTASGTTTTETDTVTVTVDRSGLNPGDHSGIVTITPSGKESQEITIRMSVPVAPSLLVAPVVLNFGDALTELIFTVTNGGAGTLSWSAADDQNWLVLTPANDTTTTETDTVTVTVDRDGLDPGDYTGTITITPDGAAAQEVAIEMSVPAEPVLVVSPDELNFGTTHTALTILLSNSGTGTLSWTAGDDAAWLSLNHTSGSITSETDTVTVTADRTGLDPGDYTAMVTITPAGAPAREVSVAMNVPVAPVLAVTPDELDFGADLTQLTFTITNVGTGTLEWEVSNNTSWLGTSPSSGTTTTEEDEISVSLNRNNVDPGDYEAVVTVTPDGGDPFEVTARMSVLPEPVMAVSVSFLEYSHLVDQKTFTITNTGTGEFSWSITSDAAWFTVNPTSGTTSSETDVITVTVDRSGEDPGRYTGNITVTPDVGVAAGVEILMSILGSPNGAMVRITGGTFEMGSPETEYSRSNNEDQHWVTLSRDFYLAENEVTNQQYLDALHWAISEGRVITLSTTKIYDNRDGSNEVLFEINDDGHIERLSSSLYALRNQVYADMPVIDVTWYGAARYCDWLSEQEGYSRAYEHDGDWQCNEGDPYSAEGYRLPTESEWEYACRAGTETPFTTGDCLDSITEANFKGSSNVYPGCAAGEWRETTLDIGSFPPNAFGLYDMHGNVRELCNDWSGSYPGGTEGNPDVEPTGPSTGTVRIVRGGHYSTTAPGCRSAARDGVPEDDGTPSIGFRPARSAW